MHFQGHEIAVTPVQMVRAFSAFARDGSIPILRVMAVARDDEQYRFLRTAVPEPVARTTREALRDVMLEGTGRRARRFLIWRCGGLAPGNLATYQRRA